MRKNKRKSAIRRVIKGILLFILAVLVINIVAAYIPFANPPALEDPAAIEARAEAMSADIETQDRATILETRTDALDERIRLMMQAKEELIITTYDCQDGESTRDILCAAVDRANAGVQVRILVDGISGRLKLLTSDLFRAVEAHPNIEIRFYNLLTQWTPWKHMGRMHDKYVIADDFAYILGGRNMFDYFLGEYPAPTHSRDREALVYNGAHGTGESADSSLFQVRDYFEAMWAHRETRFFHVGIDEARREAVYADLAARFERIRSEKPELFAPVDYAAMTEPTSGIWLISNPNTIYAKQPVVFSTLCALMRRAREDIVIHSPYVVLNADMRAALTEIAGRTPVTLMINAVENGQNVVGSGDYLYHKREVLSTGMQVLEYAGGDSYHGKSVAIDDDIAIIGSYNLDLRSTHVDTELMLVIRSRAINAQLRANMAALHADCRRVIDAERAETPDGLHIPPLSVPRAIALRTIGALMQLVRNLA